MNTLNSLSPLTNSEYEEVRTAVAVNTAPNSVIINGSLKNQAATEVADEAANESDEALDAELAIDLTATINPSQSPRLFWDQNKLVSLGYLSVDCSYLFDGFSLEVRESFKQAALNYRADGQIGLVKLITIVGTLRTAAKAHPTSIIDASWVARSLEKKNFRMDKMAICFFLQYWRDRHVVAQKVVSPDALNLLVQAAAASHTSNNVNSDDPEKSWLTDEEYDDVLHTTWSQYDATDDQQSALVRLLSLQYARRPVQLQRLKFCDLKSGAEKGIPELSENEIHFPSAKERSVEIEFRSGKFEAHPIADHLWSMLQIQKKSVQAGRPRKLSATPLPPVRCRDVLFRT
ncbi:hypothetical protein [Pseudomonas syringae]|uniref:hypothetical protein n=1 Tax=Pseudomonas syringae TaxID=317 RepID=UPI0017818986|nr:hypothetical protein [Pseudomonas syringae]